MPSRHTEEPELAEGTRLLDRYTILDRIGSGGMATIYRATDERLDRVVCVKLLRTKLVDGSESTSGRAVYEATYAHFLKEALALSKLQHPNTLRIYDFGYMPDPNGVGQGTPFHVSEYLDGGNLETHVCVHGPLGADEALAILEGVTGAVDEAHEQGILHRDIKPSNIIFARIRGSLVPKLADFGIAQSGIKKSDGDTDEPTSSVALFSPRWAAPEQLCGYPEAPRTDVYALGLLVVFMVTGGVMFGDEDARTTFNDRVRGDDLVNTRLARLGFSGALGEELRHALVARPEDRIQTAPDFYERMRLALGSPIPSGVQRFTPDMPSSEAEDRPASADRPVPPVPHCSTVSLEIERPGTGGEKMAAPERVVFQGQRRVRYVQVHEKVDLSFADTQGGQVRVRVTMLPGGGLNVKGLTCFVSRPGQRPTPAATLREDGRIDIVSTARVVLGELAWSFGQQNQEGHVFVVDGRHLLVPYSEAQRAVGLMLSSGQDLIVMCRR